MSLDPFGMDGAAPVWRALMEYVHARASFRRPTGIAPIRWSMALVCDLSGLLPNNVCPVHTEMFLDGTQPRQTDTYWQIGPDQQPDRAAGDGQHAAGTAQRRPVLRPAARAT